MHRLMLIGSLISLFGGLGSIAAFFYGRNASIDVAVFLGGENSAVDNFFFRVLSRIYPFFMVALVALCIIYIGFFIRRERTQRGGRFWKFLAIFMGFTILLSSVFYAFVLGGFIFVAPTVIVPDVSVATHVRLIGLGLLAVSLGSFLTFLGSFKA